MKNENFTRFYSTFLKLCEKHGYTVHGAAKAAGVSSGSPTAWKNGATPRQDQREKLCALFGVTDDVLMGYENKKAPATDADLSDDERELLELFRAMNVLGRAKALDHLRDLNQLYSGDNGIASREAV